MLHARAATRHGLGDEANTESIPTLEEFLRERDFIGALTLLDLLKEHPSVAKEVETGIDSEQVDYWRAYVLFHLKRFGPAKELFVQLAQAEDEANGITDPSFNGSIHWLHVALCDYYEGHFDEAETTAHKAPDDAAANRLYFQLMHKKEDEETLLQHHARLVACPEDQLTLAAVHYCRSHFEEAIRAYEELLAGDPRLHAMRLYIAMCYYRLDCCPEALDSLELYLQHQPPSLSSVLLTAACQAKLSSFDAALQTIDQFLGTHPQMKRVPIVRHNRCVFSGLRRADYALPPLIDVVPEARLNLTLFLVRRGRYEEAWRTVADFEPADPTEFIVKSMAAVALAQAGVQERDAVIDAPVTQGSKAPLPTAEELLTLAASAYRLIGESPEDADLLHGRQSMALALFLEHDFSGAVHYLDSIEPYCGTSPAFLYLKGVSLAAQGDFEHAIETLEQVSSAQLRLGCGQAATMWLARCLISMGRAEEAWLLCHKSDDVLPLLSIIGDESFTAQAFLVATRCFEALLRLAPNEPDRVRARRGLRSSMAGVLRDIADDRIPTSALEELIELGQTGADDDQIRAMILAAQQWVNSLKA